LEKVKSEVFMSAASLKKFRHTLKIRSSDIDTLGHVNNVVYLRWVQEAAESHWNSLTSIAERTELAWVVIRHEIDYYHSAKLTDDLFALTWVEASEGVKSIRIVEIFNQSEKLLAKARTTWCLIDAKTQRPKRISEDLKSIFID
jgi:acyl-CoA thioester hydrolase